MILKDNSNYVYFFYFLGDLVNKAISVKVITYIQYLFHST